MYRRNELDPVHRTAGEEEASRIASCWSVIAGVFLTMDRKLEKQHDLSVLPFGFVVISGSCNP